MSSSAWRSLVDHGNLCEVLRIFGIHVVQLILEERTRT